MDQDEVISRCKELFFEEIHKKMSYLALEVEIAESEILYGEIHKSRTDTPLT